MTNNDIIELSRRKVLAGIGTVGVASAGAGLGTTAYFSDEETFEGNQMVAGELDMKIDWTEHYSDWSDDEGEGVTVSMDDPDVGPGFPSAASPSNKLLYVSNKDQFLAKTAIEAFPDTTVDDPNGSDYDGRQASLGSDTSICDLPADLDGGSGVLSHPYRTGANVDGGVTIGDGPNAQTTAAGDPLVNISDVKPGDFGEVTFSIHLCGNPGYVWLTGDLVEASENGMTEPESKAPNEVDGTVELLDAIKTALWYDTGDDGSYGTDDSGEGDNFHQRGEAFIPISGSLRNVLQALEGSMVPLDYSPTGGSGSADPSGTSFDICTSSSDAIGVFTNSDLGVTNPRNIDCDRLAELLVSNGHVEAGTEYVGTKIEAGNLQTGIYTAGNGGIIEVNSVDISGGSITLSTNFPVEAIGIKGGNEGENNYVFEDQGGTADDGTAAQFGCALDTVTMTTPTNQAISNVEVCYDPETPTDGGDGGQDDGRECFPNSTTAYVGFEWWLPTDVGNEVQTDSVSFDLGFYTEQCRHNDGSGMSRSDN